jgi:hypothetical protein
MTHSGRRLEEVQRELLQAIVDAPMPTIEDEVQPSSRQSAEQRLDVYRIAYFARLVECLEEEFEGVLESVGERTFRQLAVEYLEKYPSTSYTLADLGKCFPKFLAETRPQREGDGPDWADFLIDLATLERTYAEIFDGPGSEGGDDRITLEALSMMSPEMRIRLCPSVRLLELKFPVHRYHSAVRRGEKPDIPDAETTRLVISRREYVVRREELDPIQHRILQSLLEQGDLEQALERACLNQEMASEELRTKIGKWFEGWVRQGILMRVETSE